MRSDLRPWRQRPLRRLCPTAQAGQALVLVALLLPVLLGMLGLAVDLGVGLASRRSAQSTADTTAYGGATLLVYNNPSGTTQYTGQDIYTTMVDTMSADSNTPHTIHLYDPTSGSPSTTFGTADLWAQYLDGSSASLGYLQNTSAQAIPTGTQGLRVQLSWPQPTYFGKAVGWQTYTVGATATYKMVVASGDSQFGLAPFVAGWDPPYGPCQAQLAANGNAANPSCTPQYPATTPGAFGGSLCTPTAYALTCLASATNSDPSLLSPYGPPVGTRFQFFNARGAGNGFMGGDPSNAALTPTLDPNFQNTISSSDFKGFVGTSGSVAACLGSYVTVQGNGAQTNAARTALYNVLQIINPGNTSDPQGVGLFLVADQAIKTSAVQIRVYQPIVLLVHLNDISSNPNGPWTGTVYGGTVLTRSGGRCSGGSAYSGQQIVTLSLVE